MDIKINGVSAEPLSNNNWKLTVRYTAFFSSKEVDPPLNFTFREAFQIWESDYGDDDQITGWVSIKKFNPTKTKEVRALSCVVSGDDLDTELGAEEIRVKVRLRNIDLNTYIEKWSGIIALAP